MEMKIYARTDLLLRFAHLHLRGNCRLMKRKQYIYIKRVYVFKTSVYRQVNKQYNTPISRFVSLAVRPKYNANIYYGDSLKET